MWDDPGLGLDDPIRSVHGVRRYSGHVLGPADDGLVLRTPLEQLDRFSRNGPERIMTLHLTAQHKWGQWVLELTDAPDVSYWLKDAIRVLLTGDPLDTLEDSEAA